jgi:hypothetical protein
MAPSTGKRTRSTEIKRSIVDSLYGQRNAKALVDMARAEKDTKMKLMIVERLSNMAPKSKEAADYLTDGIITLSLHL